MPIPTARSRRFVTSAFVLVASSAIAGSQTADTQSATTSTSPVSRVYVSYTPSGASANKIAGYAVAANGSLTNIAGTPFVANVGSLAMTGTYLFGSNLSGKTVTSFRVQSNGALQWVNSSDVQTPDPTGCAAPTGITLDHAGATIYRVQYSGSLCDHSHYQSFTIDKTNGKLHFLGKSADSFLFNSPLSISANDAFAYGSECLNYEGGPLDTFAGYARETSGLLNLASITAPDPATQNSNDFYCRAFTAADPLNHVAVTFTDTDSNNPYSSPPTQLGVYTMHTNGNLTTASTWNNMPPTEVGYVSGLAMSPDGKLLAVFGSAGLQIFHFNGASPMTRFTGLLTTAPIVEAHWDRTGHLFALSTSASQLFVFTVTTTSAAAAPGSPHAISAPAAFIVRPLTN
jgi:6-phosphogluconolactonase (cycloisomerase 2 family)